MLNNITYDTLKEEYIDDIYNIELSCIANGWSKNAFQGELTRNNVYYAVALKTQENQKKAVGFCGIYYVCGEADITNIAVLSEYRKFGIASMLLQKTIDFCKNNNINKINLEVRENNNAAISLYKKFGFEKLGLRKSYYSDTKESALIMVKCL